VHFENHKKPRLGYNQADRELANLNTLNHPIQQSEYAFYTNGNAHVANRQPIQTSQINELGTPNSNYRTLKDEDNIYYYHDLSNGNLNYIQVSCPSLLVSRAWSCATLSAWLLLLISTPVYCATLWALSYCAL
jgi:hypothetical protein